MRISRMCRPISCWRADRAASKLKRIAEPPGQFRLNLPQELSDSSFEVVMDECSQRATRIRDALVGGESPAALMPRGRQWRRLVCGRLPATLQGRGSSAVMRDRAVPAAPIRGEVRSERFQCLPDPGARRADCRPALPALEPV